MTRPHARLRHPARAAGRPRHGGDVGARLRWRLRGRQPDRRADLARRNPGHPRPDDCPLRPRPSALRAVFHLPRQHPLRRHGLLLRVRDAGAAAHHAAAAGDARAHPRRGDRRHPRRRPARHLCRLPPRQPGREGHHGGIDPRLLGADLLGRADPDPVLRRPSRLAAGREPRRDKEPLRRRVERPHAGRLEASDPAGDEPRLVQARDDDPPRPRRHARDHADRHHQVRARRRAFGSDDPAPARPEADLDPDRDSVRPRVRLDARFRGRDRDHLLLARRRQADHRFDRPARPAGDGRLPDPDRLPVRDHQPRDRPRLRAARSAPAPGGGVNAEALSAFWSEFRESRIAVAALAIIVGVVIAVIIAPLITPQDPYDLANLPLSDARRPPGFVGQDGYTHLLGTDAQGRDLYSAILYGLRISLQMGLVAGAIALAIGATLGIVAAHAGGRVEALIMRIVDLQLSFPAILLALVLAALLGQGKAQLITALVAAPLSGARIVFRHLLPNSLPPLIVVATLQVANAISLEATLSFLGLGLPPTEPSPRRSW